MKTVTVRIDYDPNTKTYGATSEELPDFQRDFWKSLPSDATLRNRPRRPNAMAPFERLAFASSMLQEQRSDPTFGILLVIFQSALLLFQVEKMTATAKIERRIALAPSGNFFTVDDFLGFASAAAVKSTIARPAVRVREGAYLPARRRDRACAVVPRAGSRRAREARHVGRRFSRARTSPPARRPRAVTRPSG